VVLFQRAAGKGHLEAAWYAGALKALENVDEDIDIRGLLEVFMKHNNDSRSLYTCARLMELLMDERMFGMLEKSAEAGDARAMGFLAWHYRLGGEWDKAKEWRERGAALDDPESLEEMGLVVCADEMGWVSREDGKSAALSAAYLEKAALRNWGHTQSRVAENYYEGKGVEKCMFKYVEWAERAFGCDHYEHRFPGFVMDKMTLFENGSDNNADDHLLRMIYAIGRAMFVHVVDCRDWNHWSEEKKRHGMRAAELYDAWFQTAQKAALCGYWVCRILKQPKEISRIIAALVHNNRGDPAWFFVLSK